MDLKFVLQSTNRKYVLRLLIASKLRRNSECNNFNLDSFSLHQCTSLFRFQKTDIKRLQKLLQIPWKFVCKHGTVCTGTEALCILLRRLAYPNRLFDLTFVFNRNEKQIGHIFNDILDHVLGKFGYLLEDFDHWWLTRQWIQVYADAVSRKGAPLEKCWAFIDGTVRAMCRPSLYQQECYNDHKRVHSLKYQSLTIPNGLIANMFGPIEGRRHDSFLLSESKLLSKLEAKNTDEDSPFCVYGDPAYPLRPELQAPFRGSNLSPEQTLFNKRMSAVRISVEWAFGKVLQLFSFVDYKKNQKSYLQPLAKYFKTAVLLTNVHTCIYGSQISDFFNILPPSAEEYLREQA